MKIDLSSRSKNLLSLTIIVFGMAVACVKQDIQPIPQTTVKVRDLERVMKAIEWLNNELPPNTNVNRNKKYSDFGKKNYSEFGNSLYSNFGNRSTVTVE